MSGRPDARPLRLVLWGDGDSPHLLKWATALAAMPQLELFLASSRGFLPGFEPLLPAARRFALGHDTQFSGGNAALLRRLPAFARWLRQVDPDWVNAHYLSSHGTMAWLAKALFLRGHRMQLAASAWGSDILVAPERSRVMRALTRAVLRASAVCTSDSAHMSARMVAIGGLDPARVMTFPFGLDALPPAPPPKDDALFYANRGLEPIYDPFRVIETFASVAAGWPAARLVVAHDGSLRPALEARVQALGLAERVRFTGRLDAAGQAHWYGLARWYLSLPQSDSVAVSVLEALGHGAIPLLSDLPANRELVRHGDNGLILPVAGGLLPALHALLGRADAVGRANRDWVAGHALFGPCVAGFVERLRALTPPARR